MESNVSIAVGDEQRTTINGLKQGNATAPMSQNIIQSALPQTKTWVDDKIIHEAISC